MKTLKWRTEVFGSSLTIQNAKQWANVLLNTLHSPNSKLKCFTYSNHLSLRLTFIPKIKELDDAGCIYRHRNGSAYTTSSSTWLSQINLCYLWSATLCDKVCKFFYIPLNYFSSRNEECLRSAFSGQERYTRLIRNDNYEDG